MRNTKSLGIVTIATVDIFLGSNIFLTTLYLIIEMKKILDPVFIISPRVILSFLFILLGIFTGLLLVKLGFKTYKLKPNSRTDNRAVGMLGSVVIIIIMAATYWKPFFAPPRSLFPLSPFQCLLLSLFLYFIWVVIYTSLPKTKTQFKEINRNL